MYNMNINQYEILIPLTSESGGRGKDQWKENLLVLHTRTDKMSRVVGNAGFKQWLQNFNLQFR